MQGHIGTGRGARHLLTVAVALLGLLIVPCASASAKTRAELNLTVPDVLGAELAVSTGEIRATQSPGGAEAIAISSETPSVCEVIGEIFGPYEEEPPERGVIAEVRYVAPGTCTFVASVKATSTTEANEVSGSVQVVARPGPPEGPGQPVPTIPEISLGSERPALVNEALRPAYLGGVRSVGARSSRPGLRVVSLTPAVCAVGRAPHAPAAVSPHAFAVQVTFLAAGTCTLTASLPKTTDREAVEVTDSILVATATFTSTPPGSAKAGGSYHVTATSAPGLPVQLRAEGACTLRKPRLEQSLPGRGHSEPAPRPPEAPATVYFLNAGTCRISAGGEAASERVSESFTVSGNGPEQITFTSTPPINAVVGRSYKPSVLSSLGWPVSFSIATPSVCEIVLALNSGSHVSLIAPGTCTIDVRPGEGSPGGTPRAHQSFTVRAAGASTSAPRGTPRTPGSPDLVGATKARVLCTTQASRCATLIIHTYGTGGPPGHAEVRTPTSFKVWVYKLGPHGEVLAKIGTHKHRLRVTPGRYALQRTNNKIVVVIAGQTREVTVEIGEH